MPSYVRSYLGSAWLWAAYVVGTYPLFNTAALGQPGREAAEIGDDLPPLPEPMSCPPGYLPSASFTCTDTQGIAYVIHQGRLFQLISQSEDLDYEIKDPHSDYRDLVGLYALSPTNQGGPAAAIDGLFVKQSQFFCPAGYRTQGLKVCLDANNQRWVIYQGAFARAQHAERGETLLPSTAQQRYVYDEDLALVAGQDCEEKTPPYRHFLHGMRYAFANGTGQIQEDCNNGTMYLFTTLAPPATVTPPPTMNDDPSPPAYDRHDAYNGCVDPNYVKPWPGSHEPGYWDTLGTAGGDRRC